MRASRLHYLLKAAVLLAGSLALGCASLMNDDSVATDGDRPLLALKHHERGLKLVEHGKLDKAEAAFQEAIIADKDFGAAHNNLGRVQFEKRDLHSAAWSFQRSIDLMPERAEPLNNLGLTFEAAGRLDQAIEVYSQAVGREPNNPEFFGNLIRARLKSGETDEMLQAELQHLLAIDTRPEWIEWAELKLVMARRQRPNQNQPEDLEVPPAGARGNPPSGQVPSSPQSGVNELPPPIVEEQLHLPGPQRIIEVR